MMENQQLIKKDRSANSYSKIFPWTFTDLVLDRVTKESLDNILVRNNFIALPYVGSKAATRLQVPMKNRRRGIWLSYIDYAGTLTVEYYNDNNLDDNHWQDSSYWLPYNTAEFQPASVGLSALAQEVFDWINSQITTAVKLNPEDLQKNSSGQIEEANRESSSTSLGYKILRLENGAILSQEMINEPNTIYEIRYGFDLNNQTITIPEGCVLRFNGGSISNGIINFSNTTLSGDINITSNVTGNILNNFANIIWFGAKENTDSTHAIQNAINVCNRVYIPKVSEGALFIIQEDIYINKPTQIYGELGNKIGNLEDIATLTLFKVVNTEHVYFYNLNLTNGTASTEKVTREISGAINIDNCTDIIIDNCKIDNIFGHWGVKVRNTTDIKVEHTSFSNITYNMLFFEEGCRNILVNNSSFINVTSLYEADRKYMISTGVTNYTDPFPLRVDNFKVINCYFENNSFWEAIDSHGGTNIFIENNIIKDCAIGIAVNADSRPALSIPMDNVVIQNNYIKGWENKQNFFGINATSGVYDYFGTNYYISNNIVIDYNTDNNTISGAIRLVGLRNAVVINNTVKGTSNMANRIYNGIYSTTCLDSNISENNISNCIYGIRCERGNYNIKIAFNTFKDLDRANIVINNTYSGLLDISGNITTPTNTGDAIFTNSTNCTGIKTNWIIGRKGFFIRTLDQRPLFAYTHDNIKRNGSTVQAQLTVTSTGEIRCADETVDLLRYMAESESLTLIDTDLIEYPVIVDKFLSPFKAQLQNWTNGDMAISSIIYDTCECVSVTSEVRDSAINLNDVFVGYDYFNKATNQVMTKDNTGNWLNMDGSSHNKVKIIYDKSFISSSGQNKILKIVSDIDLQGETLTIPANCTLDFQGGSFTNGTINFNNTTIKGNVKLLVTALGTIANTTISLNWFGFSPDVGDNYPFFERIKDLNCSYRELTLEHGNYSFSQTMVFEQSNVTIRGISGRTFGGSDVTLVITVDDVLLRLKGTRYQIKDITFAGSVGARTASVGLMFSRVDNPDSTTESALASIDSKVENCQFYNLWRGIYVLGNQIRLSDLSFSRCMQGMAFDTFAGASPMYYGSNGRSYVISRCNFHSMVSTDIANGCIVILNRDCICFQISGCHQDCETHFIVGQALTRSTIEDNMIANVTQGGIRVSRIYNSIITGNSFLSSLGTDNPVINDSPSNRLRQGIYATVDAFSSTISNNYFDNCNMEHIRLEKSLNITITGNVFRRWGQSITEANKCALWLPGTTTKVTVTANTFEQDIQANSYLAYIQDGSKSVFADNIINTKNGAKIVRYTVGETIQACFNVDNNVTSDIIVPTSDNISSIDSVTNKEGFFYVYNNSGGGLPLGIISADITVRRITIDKLLKVLIPFDLSYGVWTQVVDLTNSTITKWTPMNKALTRPVSSYSNFDSTDTGALHWDGTSLKLWNGTSWTNV